MKRSAVIFPLLSFVVAAHLLLPSKAYAVEFLNSGKVLPKNLPFSEAVRHGDTLYLSGQIGVIAGTSGEINTAAILRRHIRVQGIYVGSREMFEEMNRAIEVNQMRPAIGRSFGFEEAGAAYRYLESAVHTGKVTIRM